MFSLMSRQPSDVAGNVAPCVCDVIITDVNENRTKGRTRQPVPDSHATVPDSHARYQTEKVETPFPIEFSCLRYENKKSHMQMQESCILVNIKNDFD